MYGVVCPIYIFYIYNDSTLYRFPAELETITSRITENDKKYAMNLRQFINNGKLRNEWIVEGNYMQVYVRRSTRHIDGKLIPCLDIGSVEVTEGHRDKGIFTKFLSRFEKEAKKMNRGVFVESIVEFRLRNFLTKKGYTIYQESLIP